MDTSSYPAAIPSLESSEPRVSVFGALVEGARRVYRAWPALLLMLLGTLVSAGLLALIPALNLLNLAHRPVIAEMAARIRAWQMVDLLGLFTGSRVADTAPVGSSDLAMIFLAFVLMPIVGGIVSAFLYGGMLLTYRESAPAGSDDSDYGGSRGFNFKRFLWGCWHWFGANLVMGIVQAAVFLATYLPLASLVIAFSKMDPVKMAAGFSLVLVDLGLWLMLFELARVRMVVNGSRNPFRAIGQAIHDFFHRPLHFLVFYAAALLVLFAVQLVFRLVINPNVPLDALLLALAVQQGFILARLFCQAMRMAGVMVLVGHK